MKVNHTRSLLVTGERNGTGQSDFIKVCPEMANCGSGQLMFATRLVIPLPSLLNKVPPLTSSLWSTSVWSLIYTCGYFDTGFTSSLSPPPTVHIFGNALQCCEYLVPVTHHFNKHTVEHHVHTVQRLERLQRRCEFPAIF